MAHRPSLLKVGLLFGCMFLAGTATAGWELFDADGTRTLLQDGKLRTIDPTDSSISFVFDGSAGVVTGIYPARGLYATGDVAALCDAVGQMRGEALAGLTEEERQMMEEMLEQRAGDKALEVVVASEGAGGNVAGLPTEHYRIVVDGDLYREVWLAPELAGTGNDIEAIRGLTQALGRCTAEAFGNGTQLPETSAPYRKLMSRGWELKGIDYSGGGHADIAAASEGEVDTEIVRVQRRDIAPFEFGIPPGFRKVTFLQLLRAEMMGGMGEETQAPSRDGETGR